MELYFENVTKNYGVKKALRGISLTLTQGIYGLLGPNGAGKSTLMNILTGNISPTSGRILLDRQDIRAMGAAFRRRLGYMPQQQALYPGFTAEHFLYYMASLHDMNRTRAGARIDWALDVLNLREVRREPIRSFSGGMKQRLLLAQAILSDPDILVLDEPTAGLDPRQRIAVRNLVGELSRHKIVLLSTHVVADVEYVAKELVLLSDGNILRQATAQQLEEELSGRIWEVTVPAAQVGALHEYGQLCGMIQKENHALVRMLAPVQPPYPGQAAAPTLEDVYLHYFGDVETL